MPGLDLGGQAGTQIIGELVKTIQDGDNALLLLKGRHEDSQTSEFAFINRRGSTFVHKA